MVRSCKTTKKNTGISKSWTTCIAEVAGIYLLLPYKQNQTPEDYHMKYLSSLLLLLVVLIFNACETDFDVTADYKDITVVYGIISQNDTIHTIRINKAFLGDGNALEYAQVPDSSTYGAGIAVTLEEQTMSGAVNIYSFDTITISGKDSGLFYYPNHLVYRTHCILNPKSKYSLKIRNKLSGNETSSSTGLVQDFSVTKPGSGTKSLNFKKATTTAQKFEWLSAVNGRLYQPAIHFYYKETSSPGDTIIRMMEWPFGKKRSTTLSGGDNMSVEYLNADFYNYCNTFIPYSDAAAEQAVIARKADHLELVFTVVADDLSTYLDVNEPATGVLMEKPDFTNIVNGIGIFSARYQKYLTYQLAKETQMDLSTGTTLKFVKPQ